VKLTAANDNSNSMSAVALRPPEDTIPIGDGYGSQNWPPIRSAKSALTAAGWLPANATTKSLSVSAQT
jgi:hypothetical protein